MRDPDIANTYMRMEPGYSRYIVYVCKLLGQTYILNT